MHEACDGRGKQDPGKGGSGVQHAQRGFKNNPRRFLEQLEIAGTDERERAGHDFQFLCGVGLHFTLRPL